jgi:hypothetical protein
MLGSFVTESGNVHGLLGTIREKAPAMFAKINNGKGDILPATIVPPESATVPTSIPANVPAEPRKTKTSFWVALGLDALGAAAIGLGIYNETRSVKYHRESQKLLEGLSPEQYSERKSAFEARYKKMQDAETARNIFYATGGALLLGGIAVHIWF